MFVWLVSGVEPELEAWVLLAGWMNQVSSFRNEVLFKVEERGG